VCQEGSGVSAAAVMADSVLSESMTPQQVVESLTKFNQRNALPVSKLDLVQLEQQKLWLKLHQQLKTAPESSQLILNSVRILSRNKDVVNKVLSREFMDSVLTLAGFPEEEAESPSSRADTSVDWGLILEACKVTSNVYHQSTAAINLCHATKAIQRIFKQVGQPYTQNSVPTSVIEFDLRILFLITAHSEDARTVARYSCDGFPRLLDFVEHTLEGARNKGGGEATLSPDDTLVISSALKVLMNLTHFMDTSVPSESVEVDEETYGYFQRMARICQLAFTIKCEGDRETLVRDCIHLLTNFPIGAMSGVLAKLDSTFIPDAESREVTHLKTVVNVPKVIFDYLMDAVQAKKPGVESASPVLKVACMLSAGYPDVRKYYRSLALPPITDVKVRPEEGDSPKAVLCRLLTSSDSTLSVMVAEFLFILCKESVRRLVKHTGYGNAAGLLARKGLMGGAKSKKSVNYSSSDSDSDNEEYASNAHKVNPITGCAEEPRLNPFEGMSEEQKEYEAVKLANLIDKLHTMGVVKPAKLGEDGKPQAVEHVLELCESQAQKQMANIHNNTRKDEESDSD